MNIDRKARKVGTAAGVWCPTTGTGNWICRQNGQTFVTGNSHIADCLGYTGAWLFGDALRGRDMDAIYETYNRAGRLIDDRTRSSVTGY
jgi:hypothetical protein